ncbi:MAG TPA: hypothetical protein VI653_09520 [Steroidobacteraceae bacterium]
MANKSEAADSPDAVAQPEQTLGTAKASTGGKKGKGGKSKRRSKRPKKTAGDDEARTRTVRPYPASSFTDALPLGEAIMKFASGERVRRLTLLGHMDKSPNSGPTKQMITNSGKYGITKGSYIAEYLELTDKGRVAVDTSKPARERKQAAFDLAVDGVAPFKLLYDHYKDKRLPEREVMKDLLQDSAIEVQDLDECVDTFTVNVKDLELLKTIGGAETLVAIEQVLEELPKNDDGATSTLPATLTPPVVKRIAASKDSPDDWQRICFYITPIGTEDSLERKHADLFMSSLIQPAFEELGLTVVRADQIGEPGMITTQVLEYLKRSRLAIADLSYLNPNVFYEVALRHALRLPVVQVIRKADRLPFDVNQSRTLTFDTTDIYTLIPKLQTYRAEIANQARKALEDPESVGNPVSVFYPDFYK